MKKKVSSESIVNDIRRRTRTDQTPLFIPDLEFSFHNCVWNLYCFWCWRSTPQTRMRPFGIVMNTPSLDHDLRFF